LIFRLLRLDLDLGEAEIPFAVYAAGVLKELHQENSFVSCVSCRWSSTPRFARVKADHHESANDPTPSPPPSGWW